MQIILYIQVKPQEAIGFGNPYAAWLREELTEVVLLDADNHSEDLVIGQTLKMLAEAESTVLLIDSLPGASPGKASRLIESVFRNSAKCKLIHLAGENEVLKKMLKLSRSHYQQNLKTEDLKLVVSKSVSQYASSQWSVVRESGN